MQKISLKDKKLLALKLRHKLQSLSAEMAEIAPGMIALGGETAEHGHELEEASDIVLDWADNICNI